MDERIAIYPNWSESERRDKLCIGLCRILQFPHLQKASLTDAAGQLQHFDLLDYQTVRLAFDCETDTRHAATLDTGLVASQVGVAPTCLQLISSTHVQRMVIRFPRLVDC